MTRATSVLVAACMALAPALASARPYRSEANYVQLELPDDLELAALPVEAGEGTTLVAAFRGPSLSAAITRVDAPNRRAWRKDARFFQEVEEGLAKSVSGYKRLHRRQHKLGKVPALDLNFRRQHANRPDEVVARFLFFRTFTITLMVAVPAKAAGRARAHAVELRETLKPYFKD